MFDNGSEFKWNFTPLLKYFYLKPVYVKVNNPQDNATVYRLHQIMYTIIFTKYIDNKLFDYIDPWGKTLASIALAIRASYHRTIGAKPYQYVFGRDTIINLVSVFYWKIIIYNKQGQVYIDSVCKNSNQIIHDY